MTTSASKVSRERLDPFQFAVIDFVENMMMDQGIPRNQRADFINMPDYEYLRLRRGDACLKSSQLVRFAKAFDLPAWFLPVPNGACMTDKPSCQNMTDAMSLAQTIRKIIEMSPSNRRELFSHVSVLHRAEVLMSSENALSGDYKR